MERQGPKFSPRGGLRVRVRMTFRTAHQNMFNMTESSHAFELDALGAAHSRGEGARLTSALPHRPVAIFSEAIRADTD